MVAPIGPGLLCCRDRCVQRDTACSRPRVRYDGHVPFPLGGTVCLDCKAGSPLALRLSFLRSGNMRRRSHVELAATGPARPARPTRVLETVSVTLNAANYDSLRQGLRELGYVEGRNLVIEYRSADGRAGRDVDLIVTRGTPAALAAK